MKRLKHFLESLNKADFFCILGISLFMLAFGAAFGYPVVNLDKSIQGRLFWLSRNFKGVHQEDVIAFKFKGSRYFPEGARFLKIVVCLPGHRLVTKGRCFYCDGRFLGCAKKYDRLGNPAPLFVWNGTIPPDRYFVMGTHPDSYDSRYWGFVKKEQIIGVVKKIF